MSIYNPNLSITSIYLSTLIVTIDTSSTVKLYRDSNCTQLVQSTTEQPTGNYIFTKLNLGTYYVKCILNDKTTIEKYVITYPGQHQITCTYFTAYLTVHFLPNTNSITVTDGEHTLSTTISQTSQQSYTFKIQYSGNWSVTTTGTMNGEEETIDIIDQIDYDISVRYYLYKYGNEYTNFTGGYAISGSDCSIQPTYLKIPGSGDTYYGNIHTINTINFTPFSTINFKLKPNGAQSSSTWKPYAFIGTYAHNYTNNSTGVVWSQNFIGNTEITVNFSIETINSDYYLGLCNSYTSVAGMEVYEIWVTV